MVIVVRPEVEGLVEYSGAARNASAGWFYGGVGIQLLETIMQGS